MLATSILKTSLTLKMLKYLLQVTNFRLLYHSKARFGHRPNSSGNNNRLGNGMIYRNRTAIRLQLLLIHISNETIDVFSYEYLLLSDSIQAAINKKRKDICLSMLSERIDNFGFVWLSLFCWLKFKVGFYHEIVTK